MARKPVIPGWAWGKRVGRRAGAGVGGRKAAPNWAEAKGLAVPRALPQVLQACPTAAATSIQQAVLTSRVPASSRQHGWPEGPRPVVLQLLPPPQSSSGGRRWRW